MRGLLRMPPRCWIIAGEVGLRCVAVETALAICGFDAVFRKLRVRSRAPVPQEDLEAWCRLSRAVFRRWPWRLSCLKQSLVLTSLLHDRGIPAELKIGVSKAGAGVRAHAWVEYRQQVLLDAGPEAYDAVLSPAAGA